MIVTFAIGNSDNKLPQAGWSAFIGEVRALVDQITAAGGTIQFAGFSDPAAAWQNALWAIQLPDGDWQTSLALRSALRRLAKTYGQDAVAWWSAADVDMLEPLP